MREADLPHRKALSKSSPGRNHVTDSLADQALRLGPSQFLGHDERATDQALRLVPLDLEDTNRRKAESSK